MNTNVDVQSALREAWEQRNKLRAEGAKLWAGGDKLWAEAILQVHGDITLQWREDGSCVLETGEVFKSVKEEP